MDHHSFSIEDAKQFGTDGATIIQSFRWWIGKNHAEKHNHRDSRWWSYNSIKGLAVFFPYLSRAQVRHRMDKLAIDADTFYEASEAEQEELASQHVLLKTASYNQHPHNRTMWYAFIDEAHYLDLGADTPAPEAIEESDKGLCENSQEPLPNHAKANAPSGKCLTVPDSVPNTVKDTLPSDKAEGQDAVPYDEIQSYYNETITRHDDDTRSRCMTIRTADRMESLRARWKEPLFRENWRKVFDMVAEAAFMRRGSPTLPNFRGHIEWIIKNDQNYVKVLEGRYEQDEPEVATSDHPPVQDPYEEWIDSTRSPEDLKRMQRLRAMSEEERREYDESRMKAYRKLHGLGEYE